MTVPYCKNCGAQELQGQSFCATCGTPTGVTSGGATPLPYFPMDPTPTQGIVGLASFWRRLSGYIIDSLILGIAVSLPLRHFFVTSVETASLLTVLIGFLYGFCFMAFGGGRTLGMRAVGTRAVNVDDGARLTAPQAFRRALAYSAFVLFANLYHAHSTDVNGVNTLSNNALLLAYLFNIPHILDLLWVAWDPKKQSWHDKFARTVVMRITKQLS
jgi:uncharacterized RDD family membrane protein YckC